MNLQNVAARSVQPSQDDDIVANCEPIKALRGEWTHFKPDVGSAFRTLLGCFAPLLQAG
jgi:hypothetical protein